MWAQDVNRHSIVYFNWGIEHIICQPGRIPLEEMACWHLGFFSVLDMRGNVDQVPFIEKELRLIPDRDEEEVSTWEPPLAAPGNFWEVQTAVNQGLLDPFPSQLDLIASGASASNVQKDVGHPTSTNDHIDVPSEKTCNR